MTYTEAIDGLMSIYETVCNDYEYSVITEAVDGELPDDKKAGYVEKAKAVLRRMWQFVMNIVAKIKNAINKVMAYAKSSNMTVANDCELASMIVNPTKASTVIMQARHALRGGINSGKNDPKIISEMINIMQTEKVAAGTKLAKCEVYASMAKALEDLAKNGSDGIDRINPTTSVEELQYKNELYGTVGKLYSAFLSSYNKLVPIDKVNKNEGATDVKAESVELSKNAAYTYASLLIEAANALKESGVIYEDANSTIDPAKQKDIDDIPEEDPVVNKEYPEDTSGGQGKKDDCLDDIKDLVDGDSKAMDLLTKNDQSKTITESIDLVFDL